MTGTAHDPGTPPGDDAARERSLIEAARLQAQHRSTPALRSAGGSIPGYRILRELHRGGQGVVYLAADDASGRKVAIKVMRDGPVVGSSERARFEREARVLAQLNNPNIVRIRDSGTVGGSAYFVMDYVSGHTLDEYIRVYEIGTDKALRLFATVAHTVNAAHLRGVIHRDLKPGNIRVTPRGVPQILDFGLAKVGGSEDGGARDRMTVTGQFVGSLPWASPEQARGEGEKVDLRTDVYALGVMLYCVLCGRFPYEVEGPMTRVIEAICRATPTKPRAVNRSIPGDLEALVLTCLAKDPAQRYQTAGELARDIERYLAGEPIEAKRANWRYVAGKLVRRHWAAASLAAAAVIAASVVGGVLLGSGDAAESMRAEVDRLRAENERLRRALESAGAARP